jgi:beta-lactamase class A
VRRRSSLSVLRWISLLFIFGAALIAIFQLVHFSRIRNNYPDGMSIAGIPVDSLDRQQAGERLLQAFGLPIELHYQNAVIQIKPATLGFDLDLEGMLSAADLQRLNQPFWLEFWNSLWNRPSPPISIPLLANISETRLKQYLADEIASRYDSPPTAAVPAASGAGFQAGQAGASLNIDRAVTLIEDALRSPTARIVSLSFDKTEAPRPSFQNLQVLLRQILAVNQFEGLAELYLLDLQTNQEIHFTYQSGSDKPPQPDIAFSGESTIKIPIMVSVYRHLDGGKTPDNLATLLEAMMDRSDNAASDALMQAAIDPGRGPLEVTKDMQTIGLQNTVLGALMAKPVFLQKFSTPANQRTDVNTDPDQYNQTTATDMGMLLTDIYQCAQAGGGTLVAAFPGSITQAKCQEMVNYMSNNKTLQLFESGLPEGTRFAHKHAWATTNDGLIHTIGDAGIAFTTGGNFVLVGYMYNQVQLVFDPANKLFAQLSQAVYNYYNPAQ